MVVTCLAGARALHILLHRGEGLLSGGQIPCAQGALEGLKRVGGRAVLARAAASTASARLRGVLLTLLQRRESLLRPAEVA